MGRGPKPQPPASGASAEHWDEYYRYLRIWEDGGKKKGRRRVRDTSFGVATGVAAVTGFVTNPVPPPDTDQLDGSRDSQVERNYSSTREASSQRSRPGTSRRKK